MEYPTERKNLPPKKIVKLQKEFQRLLLKKTCSLSEARSVLGRLNFANYVVPQGRLHCRHFQRHLRTLPKGTHPRQQYMLPKDVLLDLQWWRRAVSNFSMIHLPQITHYLVTDASNYGWGALLNDTCLAGTWEPYQQTWHSNLKELVAIQRAIESNTEGLRGASLLIQSDNVTALAYLRNEGGTKSSKLMSQTRQVCQLIQDLQIVLTYQHLPGRFNCVADRLSRGKSIPEWHLQPGTRSDRQNISKIRYTSGGSLCISASPRSSPIRVPRPEGRGRSIPQCLQQAMGVPTSLGVSSSITHASGFDSPKQLQRPIYCSSPPLDKVVLETRSTEQSPQQASSNTRPTENSNRRNYQPTAPQGNRFDIESLADWSWDTLLKNWTPAEKAVLMNGWRKSTLMSYKPAWNRWVKWCLKNEVSIITPQAKDLAKFLADLHITEKLAPSTIQLHKSVVSTICEPHLSKKLSQDTFVRRVLKSVSVARPINRKVPIWDPQQVVQWLQNNVPINISFFEACRRCATILLLTSGRRVHDLTLLSISPGHIQEDNTNIILWPIFGSKTDSAQHQQSGWKLSPHDVQAICPVY
ncbi:uncharacterized protein LOC113238535 [Hyposmocoma kahamanoa]|uniref:uncharacterized protein LOC113238535 n=1 Tax=Hyposmocoma kahamanoa TaxID=1477025 RepID=UPI000E6DA38B|nr:uncharacterized protein LOC113238535 [Hyposmocoma kahamanoa]